MALEDVLPTIILVAVIYFVYRWLTGSSELVAESGLVRHRSWSRSLDLRPSHRRLVLLLFPDLQEALE